jgi:hypothetical protein
VTLLGLQDIVIANRFLCHMEPRDAERCLRNIARLVDRVDTCSFQESTLKFARR